MGVSLTLARDQIASISFRPCLAHRDTLYGSRTNGHAVTDRLLYRAVRSNHFVMDEETRVNARNADLRAKGVTAAGWRVQGYST